MEALLSDSAKVAHPKSFEKRKKMQQAWGRSRSSFPSLCTRARENHHYYRYNHRTAPLDITKGWCTFYRDMLGERGGAWAVQFLF